MFNKEPSTQLSRFSGLAQKRRTLLPLTSFRSISVIFVLSLILASCRPANIDHPNLDPKPGSRSLVILASDTPGSADPAENWSFGSATYLPQIYETLYRFVGDRSSTLVPLLAAEVPTVENGGISQFGMVYTIKLKPNVKFHDGSPINADAVVYSYQRIKSLNLGPNGITADWIDQVEKVDALTVRFKLKQASSEFLSSMGSMWGNYIVNPRVVSQHAANQDWGHTWLLDHDAGSGPYTLATFDHVQNQITLARYKDYWDGWANPKPIDTVTIRWLNNPALALDMLEKGEADIAVNLPAKDFAALQNDPRFTNFKNPSIMQYYLGINASVKPLNDIRVRQALQYSFDAEKIIQNVFNGDMAQMQAAVGPGYPDVYLATIQYPFNLDKARALLEEAGYRSGLKLSINVLHYWPDDLAVVRAWQADLAKIDVQLDIIQIDQNTWSKAWFTDCQAGSTPGIGQISTMSVGSDYPSAWEVIGQVFPTPRLGGGKCSAIYLNDPLVNNLFNNLANSTDPVQRKTLFISLYDHLANDAGAIWIGQAMDLVTMHNDVQNYYYNFSMGGNFIPLPQISKP